MSSKKNKNSNLKKSNDGKRNEEIRRSGSSDQKSGDAKILKKSADKSPPFTIFTALSVIFLFFVIAAVLYGEVPKYFLLFQFDKVYHVFGLPFNPISESPRLWIIAHLCIAIPHTFCTFYIIYDRIRRRKTSDALLTYFYYSHWAISVSIAVNMWHLGSLPNWKAFLIFTITLTCFETFYFF